MSNLFSQNRRTVSRMHQQLAQTLRLRIEAGEWPEGLLPSRKDLADEYGVSIGTVQSAIGSLLADGTLRAENRRGTFIARRGLSQELSAPTAVVREATASAVVAERGGSGALRPETAWTLGILSDFDVDAEQALNSWGQDVFEALESVFGETRSRTRFFTYQQLGEGESDPEAVLARAFAEEIDALVIVDLYDSPLHARHAALAGKRNQIPVVYISGSNMRTPCLHVFYDHHNAGYIAARHLLENGYHPLLFLTPYTDTWVEERITGAQAAVRDAGLPAEGLQIYPRHWQETDFSTVTDDTQLGYTQAQAALQASLLRGGVIAPNDWVAFGIVQAAQEQGLTPGKDFGLVGFDDTMRARALGLTSVRPPTTAMGAEAARLAMRALQGDRINMQVCVRPQLIARASTQNVSRVDAHS